MAGRKDGLHILIGRAPFWSVVIMTVIWLPLFFGIIYFAFPLWFTDDVYDLEELFFLAVWYGGGLFMILYPLRVVGEAEHIRVNAGGILQRRAWFGMGRQREYFAPESYDLRVAVDPGRGICFDC